MLIIIVILNILEISQADYCTCSNTQLNDLSKCTSILAQYCEINCKVDGILKIQLDVLDAQNSQFNNCIKIDITSQSIYLTNISFTTSKFESNNYFFKSNNLQIYQNIQNSLFGSILMFDGDHIQITNATINSILLSINSKSIHIINSTIQTNNKSCSQGELIDFLQIVPDKYSFNPNMELDVNNIINQLKLNNLRELFIQIQQTTNNYTLLIISKHIQLDNQSQIIAARIGIFSETITIFGNITAQPDCLINQGPGRGPRFIMDQGTCNGAGGSSAGNGGIGSSLNNKENCLKLYYSARSFIKQHSYNSQSYINSGSGGAGSTSYYSGGGFIIIHTNHTIDLIGYLSANGVNAQGGQGGGGGGAISLKSMNINGIGSISAKGGDSDQTSLSGEGGGGLIEILAYKEQNAKFQLNVSKGNRIYLGKFLGSDGSIRALSCPQGTELDGNLQCQPCLQGMFSFGNRGKCYKCPSIEIGDDQIQLPECPVNICDQYQCDPIKFIFDSIFSLLGFTVILILSMFVIIGYLLRRSYRKRSLNHEKLPFDFETATRYMIIDHLLTEELMQNDNFQLVDLMYHAHRITIVGNNSYNFPWYMPLQPAQEIQYLVEADEYKRFASKINSLAEWNTSQKILIYFFSILYYPLHWWYMIRIKKSKYLEIESFFNQQDMKFMKMLDDEFIQVKLSKSADYTILYLDIFNYKWSDLKYFFLACPYYIQLSGEGTFIRPLYLCESNPFLTCLYFSINITLEKEIDDERNKILENLVHHKIRMENSQKLNRFIIKFNRYARAIDLDSRSIINDVRNLLIFMHQWNEKFFSKCQIKINLFVIFNEEFTILENYDSPQFSKFLLSMKNKNIRFGLFIFDVEADLEEIDDVLENQRISFEESSHNQVSNLNDPLNEFSMDDLKERYIEREKILLHSQSQSILSSVYSDTDRLEIEKSRIERIFGFIRTLFMTHQIPTLNKYTNLALQVVATSIDALLLPVQFLGSWENISQGQLVFSSLQLYLLPYPLSIPISEILGLLWISSQSYGIAKAHLIFVVLSAFNLLLNIILLMIEKQFLVMSIPVNIIFYCQVSQFNIEANINIQYKENTIIEYQIEQIELVETYYIMIYEIIKKIIGICQYYQKYIYIKEMADQGENSREDEYYLPKKSAYPPIVMNIYDTNYSVVRQVAQEMMKWKLIYEPESLDWDVYWTDSGVSPETLSRMKCIQIEKYELEYQKINHFPGMYILARKNNLGKQLTKMKRRFTKEYHFFPQTWMLPSDINEFKEYCKTSKGKHFIVKPEAACQGRGIFLTRNSDFANSMDRYVVQKYISKPFLIDGLKFDFRIYVLLAGCDPLRIFIYTEGLARFSTEVYEEPNQNNYQNLCMHLTNYAINKNNENFIFNEDVQQMDVGHKRSMSSVFEKLREMGHDIDVLWMEVKDVVIKTLCSAQPFLKHQYTTSQPNNLMNNMCFELLGFDIILDEQFRPYILEVNHSPSFTTDSPLDAYIKSNLIQDSLILMNVTPEEKQRMIQEKNQEMKKRIYTGRNVRMTLDDRKMIVEQNQLIRDAYEDDHLGGFEKIYPCDEDYETEYYQKYINFASDQFEESTGTKKPLFMKRQVIQTTPQKQQTKKDEITQIYSKASTFLQKPFLKSSQGQRQQMKMLREDHQFTAETAYRQSIKMQILSEQKKIQELIKKKKRDESQLSQSYQGQRTSLQLKLNRDLRRK